MEKLGKANIRGFYKIYEHAQYHVGFLDGISQNRC